MEYMNVDVVHFSFFLVWKKREGKGKGKEREDK
jgi:hypothetical protein